VPSKVKEKESFLDFIPAFLRRKWFQVFIDISLRVNTLIVLNVTISTFIITKL
jgi:hypothetical protein